MTLYDFCKKALQTTILKLYSIEVINPEKEPSGGVLVCPNHISNIDPVVICASFKKQVCFMAKKELFKIPFLNLLLPKLGAFPVNRGGADLNAIKSAIKLLGEDNLVGMFPQGTRVPGVHPRESEVKNGVGMLVARSSVDVLPVAIITKNNKFSFGRKVFIVLGDVIRFDEFSIGEKTKEEFSRVSSIVFDRICALYDEYSYLAGDRNGKQ